MKHQSMSAHKTSHSLICRRIPHKLHCRENSLSLTLNELNPQCSFGLSSPRPSIVASMGCSDGERVLIATSSILFTKRGFGAVPTFQLTIMPSKQSIPAGKVYFSCGNCKFGYIRKLLYIRLVCIKISIQ